MSCAALSSLDFEPGFSGITDDKPVRKSTFSNFAIGFDSNLPINVEESVSLNDVAHCVSEASEAGADNPKPQFQHLEHIDFLQGRRA